MGLSHLRTASPSSPGAARWSPLLPPMLLALTAREFMKPAVRAILALLVACVIGAIVFAQAPQCLGAAPYGMVDPLLARLWLGKVGEAQPLFTRAPPALRSAMPA